jgi:hypothetical protein
MLGPSLKLECFASGSAHNGNTETCLDTGASPYPVAWQVARRHAGRGVPIMGRAQAQLFNIYEGPYEIIEKIGQNTYKLICHYTGQLKGPYNISLLKKYVNPPNQS